MTKMIKRNLFTDVFVKSVVPDEEAVEVYKNFRKSLDDGGCHLTIWVIRAIPSN